MSDLSRLLILASKRWRKSAKAQLAAVTLTAAVVAANLLFAGYVAASGQRLGVQVKPVDLVADAMVERPEGVTPYSRNGTPLASWILLTAKTSFGVLDLGAVTSHVALSGMDCPAPNPAPGELWVPSELAGKWDLQPGDELYLALNIDGRSYEQTLTITGMYDAGNYDQTMLVNRQWLSRQIGQQITGMERTIYRVPPGGMTEFIDYMSWRSNVKLITPDIGAQVAREMVDRSYAAGSQARMLMVVFLVLGAGTIGMLSFMDGKRELSVLKSLGLRPKELGALFAVEGIFNGVLGLTAGVALAMLTTRLLPFPTTVRAADVGNTCLLVLVSYMLGISLPYLLASKATVNELLLDRPIPLIRKYIKGLSRRYPALEGRIEAGLRCLKLGSDDGVYEGIIFRKPGESVKIGETVAWERYAWGLGEKHFIAPCDGEVLECDQRHGIIAIKPCREASNN